jgi:di/tricarboxylate transporter
MAYDPALITLLILAITAALLVTGTLRADLVALLSVVVLGLTGVLTPQEAFSGFGRSAVITILAVFILAEALRRTGATERLGNYLLHLSGAREAWLVVLTMLAGALLSLFMNNIAAAAVLLPAVASAGQRARVSPSRLLMPLAFGTIVGGMATLLTTVNIIVSNLLRDGGTAGYGLLDFARLGLPLIGLSLAYMALVGRRLLPVLSPAEQLQSARATPAVDLVDVYRLGQRLFRVLVPPGSALVNTPLADSALRETFNVSVVAIQRGGRTIPAPGPQTILRQGDVVVFTGDPEKFQAREDSGGLKILPAGEWSARDLESPEVVVVEAVLTPRSDLIGRTLRESNFREKYGMTVLAILSGTQVRRTGLADLPLQFGDALLLQGPRSRLRVLQGEPNIIVLANERAGPPPATGRRRVTLAILGATLALAAVFPPLVGEIMLGGALAMVLIGMLTMDQVYQAVEWKTVFLVAGLLPLGIAITKTGIAASLAQQMVGVLGPAGPLALVAGLSLIALMLVQIISAAAVATILAPIAIHTAQQIGADPRAVAMGLVLAASMTFLTPLGHPVNILVMGPGGYGFRDFFKVGLPLTAILFAAVLALLPLLWPLAG